MRYAIRMREVRMEKKRSSAERKTFDLAERVCRSLRENPWRAGNAKHGEVKG